MDASKKGRYCASCAKNVIDFSRLSDNEIFKLIENTNGNICGHFSKDQLNKLIMHPTVQQSSGTRLYKYLAGLLLMATPANLQANLLPDETEITAPAPFQQQGRLSCLSQTTVLYEDTTKYIFSGTVLDAETNEPVAGVKIQLKNLGTETGSDGNFSLFIPTDSVRGLNIISIHKRGHMPFSFGVKKEDLNRPLEFFLEKELSITGQVEIITIPRVRKKK